MNLYFADNLDTDTAGALPAWMTAISGTWEVVADSANAYSSPNDLQCVSHVDGQKLVITGGGGVTIPATADMIFEYVTNSMSIQYATGLQPIIRSDSATANFYVWILQQNSGSIYFQLYKCVSGSLSTVGGSVNSGITYNSGVFYNVKVAAIGTTISAKVWQTGTSEPGSYQASQTDSSVSAAGYPGFYNEGTAAGAYADNLQLFGNSSLAAGTISSSGITASTATLTATAATGGTAPYTYQWYRSTASGFVPRTSNVVSGATSLTLNDSGLAASTTYYYLLIATDATGAIAWSSQASITTSAGALTSGTSSASGITSTGCTVTNTGASGGVTPYAYQWYRSTTSGFTPGSGNIITGATTLTYNDSGLSPSTTYYYKLVTTDSEGTPASVTAAQISVTTSAPASLAAGSVSASNIGSTTATVTSTSATGGYPAYSYQWYRSTTSGFTPNSGNAVSGATSLTLNDTGLSPSTTYYYVIGVTDTHSSTAFSSQASLTTSASFSAGTAYATYVGVKTVQLSASNATGGSGTYTYQWYRSLTSGSNGTAISGATAEAYIDTTVAAGTTYYYALQYTDTTGGAQVLTPQVVVTTKASSALEIVGGIGDSIEAGSYSTIETPFAAMIDQLNFGMMSKEWYGGTNTTGTSGGLSLSLDQAISGTTTTGWLPSGSYLPGATSALSAAGATRIIINLGANDAAIGTSPSTYQSNLSSIIAYLFANISTLKSVHLVGPMFQGEATGSYGVGNAGILVGYDAAMAALANGSTIFHASALGPYNYMQRRGSILQRSDDLHPNDYGDQAAGGMWASQIILALNPGTVVYTGYSRSRVVNGC